MQENSNYVGLHRDFVIKDRQRDMSRRAKKKAPATATVLATSKEDEDEKVPKLVDLNVDPVSHCINYKNLSDQQL